MAKTTQRYDESFAIPADATGRNILAQISDVLHNIESSGADIDWANLEISSERCYEEPRSNLEVWTNVIREYTLVTLTARGRK